MDELLKNAGSVEIGFWLLEKMEEDKYILDKISHLKKEMGVIKWIKKMVQNGYTIKEIKKILKSSFNSTISYAQKFLNFDARVVTISNSKTLEVYFKTHPKNLEIVVPVSNPGGEGKILYDKLKSTCNVKLINDFEVEKYIKDADYIVTGADSVCENGVINKIGSKTLAILSKYYDKPFFVIADKTKFFDSKIENKIFELIPFKLITAIISGEI
ncbi:initiation factor 2B [Thermosipho affectus]|uniref:Initiation factor 2B n=1 Tax=Thermosipho affectus TaxID=660294 RepID=A0ABX3IGK1_9BACT|nr:initiation factor 2B [Thermosipho affectus]ONN26969.1 initiation factor 2B [Thermosipho affectus]